MSPLSAITPSMSSMMPQDFALPDKLPDMLPNALSNIKIPAELSKPLETSAAQSGENSFATMLGRMVADVNATQHNATQTINALQSGQNIPLHQTIIAMEEANVSFQLMVEVRNKLLESYQELMRMQI